MIVTKSAIRQYVPHAAQANGGGVIRCILPSSSWSRISPPRYQTGPRCGKSNINVNVGVDK
jgi:hypothetical protein